MSSGNNCNPNFITKTEACNLSLKQGNDEKFCMYTNTTSSKHTMSIVYISSPNQAMSLFPEQRV